MLCALNVVLFLVFDVSPPLTQSPNYLFSQHIFQDIFNLTKGNNNNN
jgi:hypothetical protein